MTPEQLAEQVRQLSEEVALLRQTIDHWRRNGLVVLETGSLYSGSGGLYGTSQNAARANHSH